MPLLFRRQLGTQETAWKKARHALHKIFLIQTNSCAWKDKKTFVPSPNTCLFYSQGNWERNKQHGKNNKQVNSYANNYSWFPQG